MTDVRAVEIWGLVFLADDSAPSLRLSSREALEDALVHVARWMARGLTPRVVRLCADDMLNFLACLRAAGGFISGAA